MIHGIEVARVKHLLTTINNDDSLLIFVDRAGEIDVVSEPGNDDDTAIRLNEEARARSGGPFFQILSSGTDLDIYDAMGQLISIDEDDLLDAAVDYAIEERKRFYAEKEVEFGSTARPVIASTVSN